MPLGITGHRALSPNVEAQVRAELGKLVGATTVEDLVGISCIADGPDAMADGSAELGHRIAQRAAGRDWPTAAVREVCVPAAAHSDLATLRPSRHPPWPMLRHGSSSAS